MVLAKAITRDRARELYNVFVCTQSLNFFGFFIRYAIINIIKFEVFYVWIVVVSKLVLYCNLLFLLLIWFNVRHLRVNFDDYFDWCLRNFGDTKEKNSKDDEKKN